MLFNKYHFDDLGLIEIKDNKLYANYWNYQSNNELFRFEIDLLTKEVKDTFYDSEKQKYLYENPKTSLWGKVLKWIRR